MPPTARVGIAGTSAGNIRSVVNALNRLGVSADVSNDPAVLAQATHIILPGVGEARTAMGALDRSGLSAWLREARVPFLGICLGMQLLFDHSTERDTRGLGIVAGTVRRFEAGALKVPHMGWNTVTALRPSPLLDGIAPDAFFYFVHSYYAPLTTETLGQSEYGIAFASVVQRDNFYGVQFHPEKSGAAGLHLLKNFLERC